MLDLIRKKQKSIIVKVIFWTIIATFVGTIFLVWGKGSDDTGAQDSTVAVTVNKNEIGIDEYQMAYGNLYRLYQNIYRDQFNSQLEKQLKLRQQALDGLIEQTLLLEEAKRLGVKVTEQELVDAIARIPAFQENGAFSKERYLQVLNYQRLTPDDFEKMQRRELMIDRARASIQGEIKVNDADIAEEYRRQNEKIDLAFVRLTPARFEEKVRIDEKSLADFFAAHREEFRTSEAIALSYLIFEPTRFEKDVTFEEGDLERYYRRHLDLFDTGSDVKKFSEISDQVKDQVKAGVRKEKARQLAFEKAMDAYNINRKGGNIEAAAKANNLSVMETGFFTREEPVAGLGDFPQITAAAFPLKEGELARPAELPQGAILFTVKTRRASRLPELAEVRSQVEKAYRIARSKELARETGEKMLAAIKAGQSLDTVARQQGESVEQTGLFTRSYGALVPRLGNAEELANAAFSLSRTSPAAPKVYEVDGTFVVAALRDRQEAAPTGFNPAHAAELREALLTRKKDEVLANRIKELREKADVKVAAKLQSSIEEEGK